MAMEWVPVESSNINEIGFDADASEWTLGVRFRNGTEYHYRGVSQDVYTSFLASDSKGKFLHTEIKSSYAVMRAS